MNVNQRRAQLRTKRFVIVERLSIAFTNEKKRIGED
jgi:hypothetical protein